MDFDSVVLSGDDELEQVLLTVQKNSDKGAEKTLVSELKNLSENGNLCASYHLGLFYLFGQMPRYYHFEIEYPPLKVKTNARYEIDERVGLEHLIELFDLERDQIKEYQLKGLYDLFKIVDGKSPFFKTNDLSCRPSGDDEENDLSPLFESVDDIRDILKDMDYYEAYIDIAENSLNQYELNKEEEHIKEAIHYLNQIVYSQSNFFDQQNYRKASFILGRVLLWGNQHVSRNVKLGLSLLEKSRLDEAYLEIINYVESKKGNNNLTEQQLFKLDLKISRCVERIASSNIKKQLLAKYNLEDSDQEIEADLVNALYRLKETSNTDHVFNLQNYSTQVVVQEEVAQEDIVQESTSSDDETTDINTTLDQADKPEIQDIEDSQSYVGDVDESIDQELLLIESDDSNVQVDEATGFISIELKTEIGVYDVSSDDDDDFQEEEDDDDGNLGGEFIPQF